jgi:Trk K+ transport system NAD-binding subunit
MHRRHATSKRFRTARAALRDAWLILRESAPWLLAFGVTWLGFGLILWRFYRPDGAAIWLSNALYVAFAQMLFQPQPFPDSGVLQVLFFLAPAIGLALVGRGALNAGLLIFDKRNRREAWQMALASTYRDHIIVCGLGKVGYRVVGQLLATGHDVVGIERGQGSEFVERLRGQGVPIITGDARRLEVLQAAGLQHAHSVVCVINDDLTNLDIALTARQDRQDIRIVLRIFNDALAEKLQLAFNIKTAFSTSALAAPTFAAAAVNRDVTNALYVGGKFLTTQEITVAQGGALDGRQVGTIEQAYDISVLYRRNERGEDLRPRGDYRLASGDIIVIIGTLTSLEQIAELNRVGARPHVPESMRQP